MISKVDLFHAWVRRRRSLVPDEEEEALKKRLQRCQKARKAPASHQKSVETTTSGASWRSLPYPVRAIIFDYLPVLPPAAEEDLAMFMRIVMMEDASILRSYSQHPSSLLLSRQSAAKGAAPTPSTLSGRNNSTNDDDFHPAAQFDDMFAYLEREQSIEYPSRLGAFAVAAVRLGMHPHQNSAQRQYFIDCLRAAGRELRFSRTRIADLGRWVEFREEMLRTPCSVLRPTIREDLALWKEVMRSWQEARSDVAVRLALDELHIYERRVKGVEYIGQPSVEVADIRNMLWDVNLRAPDGTLSDDYPRTITMGQAMTLGIVDLPWVRGYAWEEREAPSEDPLGPTEEDQSAYCAPSSTHGDTTTTFGAGDLARLNSAAGGSRSRCSTSKQERIQQLLGLTDQSSRRQEDELEIERARLEVMAAEQRARAHEVAADGMTQRLWISTQTFLPRWKHRFCGCEMCAKLPLHHVGLRRENCGAAVDIVLCNDCFNAHYGAEDSVAHRMYTWFLVRDLITT
jgi:hypothetical protein